MSDCLWQKACAMLGYVVPAYRAGMVALFYVHVVNALLKKLECGPMPNLMVALPNIGGTLCSTRKVWLTLTT